MTHCNILDFRNLVGYELCVYHEVRDITAIDFHGSSRKMAEVSCKGFFFFLIFKQSQDAVKLISFSQSLSVAFSNGSHLSLENKIETSIILLTEIPNF